VVHPSTPARTVKEVIALAKAKPGMLNFASAGVGSSSHLAGELFRILAGAEIVHVPYKGAGPAMVDVLSGQIQLYFATMPAAMPHVKSGKLAPAHTPNAAIARLHGDTVKILAVPEFRERLAAQGFEPVGSSPEEFSSYQ